MMNFIRDNIVKIAIALVVIIVIIIIVVACSPSSKTVIGKSDKTYAEMETRLQNAAIKLVDSNKRLLPKTTDQVRKVQLSTLISNGLIKELHAIEDSNTVCKGYVDITKISEDEENYRYTPYIKCGKYYETKTIAEYIIENEEVVTTGEGLYQVQVKTNSEDQDEEYSYYFKGEYPNNYITLGNKIYRIMEITEDNNLKLISTTKTSRTYTWDNRFNSDINKYYGINDFSKSRLKENLNFLYNNTDENEGEIYFSSDEKSYIVKHDFCTGKRSEKDKMINSGVECETKESLYVGLITVQDYYKVSTASNCDAVGKQECNNYNYLYMINEYGTKFLTLTANKDFSYEVFIIDYGSSEKIKCNASRNLYPVIYIDKNILYSSGTGSKDNPYKVR